jgi:glycosyltransferase involved in cell wall biosynthesis
MSKPLVSIITAVYNSERFLEKTIQSVISQTYENIEYIIIDGGSIDGSINIIKKYHGAIDYWISEPDKGIYEAFNKGVLVSKGDWVSFLGAGDMYYEKAIENYVDRIFESREKDLEYISSRNELISEEGKVLRIIGSQWQWKHFKRQMSVAHVGSLHHKRLFQKYGYFDPTYKISGDYELLLRAGENLRAGYIDEITTKILIGGVSHNYKQALEEVMKAKLTTGKRDKSLCHMEKNIAILKSRLRSAINVLSIS